MKSIIFLLIGINLLLFGVGRKEFKAFKKSEEYRLKDEFKFRSMMFLGFGVMKIGRIKRYKSRLFEIFRRRFNSIEKTVSYYRAIISNLITACVVIFDANVVFTVAYVCKYGLGRDVWLLGALCLVEILCMGYGQYKQVLNYENKRAESVLAELANVVNKISILQASGASMENIIMRIAEEDSGESNPIYKEFQIVAGDISNGKGAVKGMQGMNQRIRKPEMSRFTSAIIQNLTHGTEDCAKVLSNLADEMWKMRRAIDKKKGQFIKEMMLIPTLVCFGVVMVIVIAPAFMGLRAFC